MSLKESKNYPNYVYVETDVGSTAWFKKEDLGQLREDLKRGINNAGEGVRSTSHVSEITTRGTATGPSTDMWIRSKYQGEGGISISQARQAIKDIENIAEREARINEGLKKMKD